VSGPDKHGRLFPPSSAPSTLAPQGEIPRDRVLRPQPKCDKGVYYYDWREMDVYIASLEAELARERESRKQAEDALPDDRSLTLSDRQFIARIALVAANQLVWALASTPDVLPAWTSSMYSGLKEQLMQICEPITQEPAERERGK
jgi:hypothetical protein